MTPRLAANDSASLQAMLGYRFDNQALLARALTHRSCGGSHNERLEYLGDSILGFVIAETLFTRFPAAAEGNLTRMRARLVRRETLAAQARRLNMQRCLLLGGGALKSGENDRDAVLADAFEAVVGAIYLDGGLEPVRAVLLGLFEGQLAKVSQYSPKDDKTRLQEHLQKHGLPLPIYEVVKRTGKPHALTFTVACRVENLAAPVIAVGDNRRSAEQESARKTLAMLEGNG